VDVVIIVPEPGKLKEIGQQLLALADSPGDVQWVSWPQAGYRVPAELAGKLKDVRDNYSADSVDQGDTVAEPPRRRGRPRKTVEAPVRDTDDTEKEE